jgi:hypothetical protein
MEGGRHRNHHRSSSSHRRSGSQRKSSSHRQSSSQKKSSSSIIYTVPTYNVSYPVYNTSNVGCDLCSSYGHGVIECDIRLKAEIIMGTLRGKIYTVVYGSNGSYYYAKRRDYGYPIKVYGVHYNLYSYLYGYNDSEILRAERAVYGYVRVY